MCGIAGLVWKNQKARKVDDFRRAAALIEHRGPDAKGEFLDDRLLLLHYRLAIVALGEEGSQPFFTKYADTAVGVYNGELYNHKSIRQRYHLDLNTASDTETFLSGIHARGPSIIPDYNGIFAFAQYFPARRELLIARDRLGVKPLYYIDCEDYFAFASEAKVLFSFMPELTIEEGALHEFLRFGSSMSTRTVVRDVWKLEPGTFMKIDLESFVRTRKIFWSVRESSHVEKKERVDYHSAKEQTGDLLSKAVARQCMADVPIGSYLSGGLDSSLVTAMAAAHAPGRLATFSVCFEGSENSELPLARQVAQRYGTEHHEMTISTRGLEEDLERLIFQYDEPFADPAAVPLHLMAERCSSLTKVVLQGDGGDELCAGYGRHLDLSQYWRRRIAFGLLSVLHPKRKMRGFYASRSGPLAKRSLADRLAALTAPSNDDVLASVLRDPFRSNVLSQNEIGTFQKAASEFAALGRIEQMLCTDLIAILPHTFLEKVDKVSMWHGLEARVPMLDNDLVSFVMNIPGSFKVRNGVTKRILRDVAQDWLPPEVVIGRKQSFGTPMAVWLRTLLHDFAADVFSKARSNWSYLFDFDRLEHLLCVHRDGDANYAAILWRMVVLLVWLQTYHSKIRMIAVERA